MSKYFGTDGIRGVFGEKLTLKLAYNLGIALSQYKKNCKVIIGRDTRKSGESLVLAVCLGIISGGGDVIDVGIIPTPGVSFLVKKENVDFGVMITASHNPPEYNGIKVFDKNGRKLGDDKEILLEKRMSKTTKIYNNFGSYKRVYSKIKSYEKHLIDTCKIKLEGLKIVLDTSNGASYKIALNVFKKLGAEVICINNKNYGDKINVDCGALYPQVLVKKVIENKADIGFAFDGDADRIISIDEEGNVLDGDKILLILARFYQQRGILGGSIVATNNTNMGIEELLKEEDISLIRTDVGDKYVSEELNKRDLLLGGEQSGHIIIREFAESGDGVLTAIQLAKILKLKNQKISKLSEVKLYVQKMISIEVYNKNKILDNIFIQKQLERYRKYLGLNSRILIRASGTEPKIRVLIEGKEDVKVKKVAEELEQLIKKSNME